MMQKKILSLVLLTVIVVSLLSMTVIASDDDSGQGFSFMKWIRNMVRTMTGQVISDPACGMVVTDDVILTTDMNCTGLAAISVGANAITIDCQGHTIYGVGASYGILVSQYHNVTIQNCDIKNFHTGINLEISSDNNLFNNNITCPPGTASERGVYIGRGASNYFENTSIDECDYGIYVESGFCCGNPFGSDYNVVKGGSITNAGSAIAFRNGGDQQEYNNFTEIYVENVTYFINGGINANNIYWDNDINNYTYAADFVTSSAPEQFNYSGIGNHWDKYDEDSEGCYDVAPKDDICDDPYEPGGDLIDYFPQVGTGGGIQPELDISLNLNPNPVNVTNQVTASGHVQLDNGIDVVNNPINVYLDDSLISGEGAGLMDLSGGVPTTLTSTTYSHPDVEVISSTTWGSVSLSEMFDGIVSTSSSKGWIASTNAGQITLYFTDTLFIDKIGIAARYVYAPGTTMVVEVSTNNGSTVEELITGQALTQDLQNFTIDRTVNWMKISVSDGNWVGINELEIYRGSSAISTDANGDYTYQFNAPATAGIKTIKVNTSYGGDNAEATELLEVLGGISEDSCYNVISYWSFDDVVNLGKDDFGVNDGTVGGSPAWITGKSGGALDFDGSADYVEVPTIAGDDLDVKGEVTIVTWVMPDATMAGWTRIFEKDWRQSYFLGVDITGTGYAFGQDADGSTGNLLQVSSSLVQGTWQHLAGVYNGTHYLLYIDGVLAATKARAVTVTGSSNSLLIAKYFAGAGYSWNGKMDEVAIFDKALNSTEIQNIYGNGVSGIGVCDAVTCSDADGDSYSDIACGGTDCDDSDEFVNPGAVEICDGVDNNCDGNVDEGFSDGDSDGVADCVDNCVALSNPNQADSDFTYGEAIDYALESLGANVTSSTGSASGTDVRAVIDGVDDVYGDCNYTTTGGLCAYQASSLATITIDLGQPRTIASAYFNSWNRSVASEYYFYHNHKWEAEINGEWVEVSTYYNSTMYVEYTDEFSQPITAQRWRFVMLQATYSNPVILELKLFGAEGDGIGDVCDNCWYVGNPLQEDSDADCSAAPYLVDPQCGDACDAVTCSDSDGDSYLDAACGGTDCDDDNALIHPGAVEICDGVDNNCDGNVDEGFSDGDGDGVADCVDNCVTLSNPDQADSDLGVDYATENYGATVTSNRASASGTDVRAVIDGVDIINGDCNYTNRRGSCAYQGYYFPLTLTINLGAPREIAAAYFNSWERNEANGWYFYYNTKWEAVIDGEWVEVANYLNDTYPGYVENLDEFDEPISAQYWRYTVVNSRYRDPVIIELKLHGVGDGFGDVCDNCWYVGNPLQEDSDADCSSAPYLVDPQCGDSCGCLDNDGDSYLDAACGGNDCNDNNASIHPGAVELCDGADNDCDGDFDEGCEVCGNEVVETGEQCDDGNNNWYDGCSPDCNIECTILSQPVGCEWPPCNDSDDDGFFVGPSPECGILQDCNDNNANVNPDGIENNLTHPASCTDGLDNDCDGDYDNMDDGCRGISSGEDIDLDGYCNCPLCPPDYRCLFSEDDCDDGNISINPGATEVCGDNVDNNCDGNVDEGCCLNAKTLVSGYSDDNIVCTGLNCVLQGDVEFCDGQNGYLFEADNIHLDCQGYAITSENKSNGYGVWSNVKGGIEVRNCEIADFLVGIRITNAKGNIVLENNDVHDMGDRLGVGNGIWLHSDATVVPTNNIVRGNNISAVGSYPLYDGTGSFDIIEYNYVNGTGNNRNVFITSKDTVARYNNFIGEGLEMTAANSIAHDNSLPSGGGIKVLGDDSIVYGNTLNGGGIRTDADNDEVINNTIMNAGVGVIVCARGQAGDVAYNVSVEGNTIINASNSGVIIGGNGCDAAMYTRVVNNTIIGDGTTLQDGVRMVKHWGNNTLVANNTIIGVGNDAVEDIGFHNIIQGNYMDGGKDVLRVSYGYNSTIFDNTIINGWNVGVSISTPSTFYNNNVYNNNIGLSLATNDTLIYHNNIYDNTIRQASDTVPIEMSYLNEGNFWGRTNTSEDCCFEGTDTNALSVDDTHCYWQMYGWLYACEDNDNDGHPAIYCGGDDCNDNDVNVYPGAPENTTALCSDLVDNDCDGDVDVNDSDCNGILNGQDLDLDGYCECPFCPPVYNCIFGGNDCNDLNENIYPGAVEVCNGVDDDCDTLVDENNGDCGGVSPYCVNGTCIECVDHVDCDDGLFCNGYEACDAGVCLEGVIPITEDGVSCTVDSCDEVNDVFVHIPDDSVCLDGLWCNGDEWCDAVSDCQPGLVAPECVDGIECTNDSCEEGVDTGDNLGSCVYDTTDCDCTVDTDCDDGNACTDDVCGVDLTCANTNNDANSCDDGFFCTVDDSCSAGVCLGITAPITDGIGCTTDSCDEENDIIVHIPIDAFCDNGLYCDGVEVCDIALDCQNGTEPNTDDLVGCTVDSCDEINDVITNIPNDAACLNGDYCDGAEFCDVVLDCQDGDEIICDDGFACTDDTCEEGVPGDNLGSCVFDTANCVCTTDAECEDNNPCTDDSCVAFDCVNSANNLNSCDDGFFCTINDRCSAGSCVSDARDIDDLVGCTTDSCDEDLDLIVHLPVDSVCDDGLYCDGAEFCDVVLDCQAGTEPVVDDGVGCTNDICDEDTDTISHTPDDSLCLDGSYCNGTEFCDMLLDCQAGTPPNCDDNILCTINGCDEGVDLFDDVGSCVFDNSPCECEVDVDCDDGNPCTDNSCNANLECVTVNNANSCDDGFFCTINDRCEAGSCVADARNTDDGVGCTTDSCDEVNDLLVHNPVDSVCDDGAYCDGAEYCDVLLDCQGGTPPNLDDGVSCTEDTCDEINDMPVHTPDDSVCDNGNYCDGAEYCDVLLDCKAGNPVVYDDGVGCTLDSCNPVNGVVVNLPDDSLCLNGLYCDGAEFCDVVLDCQVGTSPTCDDGIFCTIDNCSEGGNLFDNVGSCVVDNSPCECTSDAECDDGNSCTDDSCNANLECVNTNNDANSCDDGFFCTLNDRCEAGSCIADNRNVDDLVGCTVDSCDEVNDIIVHNPKDAVCDDGLYCDGIEYCDVVLDCQNGTIPNTDDGVGCTLDSCDEDTDTIKHVADDSVCLNGDYCDGAEYCDQVLDCQNGTAPVCNDGIFCTQDSCDEGANPFDNVGSCIFDTTDCDCVLDSDCEDNNPCTDDSCNANFECVNTNNDANTCSDDAWCTVNDRCEAGSCASDLRVVDDGIPCTLDSCDEEYDVLVHNPNNAFCDDGLYCNGVETCDGIFGCENGTAPTCNDGLSCTDDSCNELTDGCSFVPTDNDADGFDICSGVNQDCDDTNSSIYPGAVELCNGVDDDCDGDTDEGCAFCGNGVLDYPEMCDDGNSIEGDGCSSACEAELFENCSNTSNIIDNGDGTYTYRLLNEDGVVIVEIVGNDGLIDFGDAGCELTYQASWKTAISMSGIELSGATKSAAVLSKNFLCAVDDDEFRAGNTLGNWDCKTDPNRILWTNVGGDKNLCGEPGAPVIAKDKDGNPLPQYTCEKFEAGGDVYAKMSGFVYTSVQAIEDADEDGYTVDEDCDDNDEFINPGAAETCDGIDNNCDGLVDYSSVVGDLDETCGSDSCQGTDVYFNFYCDEGVGCAIEQLVEDNDADGFNGLCTDCDDANAATYPGAVEECPDNGIDNNCDGISVFSCDALCDVDGDGYFNATIWYCFGADCDDSNADINPGAVEVCNGVDDDCSGVVDDADADGDSVNDCFDDKCFNTVVPELVPTESLNPQHYAELDGDFIFEVNMGSSSNSEIINSGYGLAATHGCSCEQILECKPGKDSGEYKFGCSQGTLDVWTTQTGWAPNCQEMGPNGFLVVKAGETQEGNDNDGDGIVDEEDADDDNDGVLDVDDSQTKDKDNKGKPDWWCAKNPSKC